MQQHHFQRIDDEGVLTQLIVQTPALALWFSGPDCGVCAGLKPKLLQLFKEGFPRFQLAEVDSAENPELAAQQMVFSIPTLIIFLHGRESLRLSRNLSLSGLRNKLQRSYSLLFS